MKRTALFLAIALVGGLALGTLLGRGVLSADPASATTITPEAVVLARPQDAASDVEPLDQTDNMLLLEQSEAVLYALKEKDYSALSMLVHPELGLTLTPYSTVSLDHDRNLTPAEVAGLADDQQEYVWGVLVGPGSPIRATCAEYFARYVFNTDFTKAPEIGVDTVLMQGNALENVDSAYPDARFVEYHFPGIDPDMEGYDWCSLKLVFQVYQNKWYLVGLVHSEWTI